MAKLVSRVGATAAMVMMSGAPLWAQTYSGGGRCWFRCPPVAAVPEIDASAGMLAVAAVLAILLFIRERRQAV